MSLPGFRADRSLYRSRSSYRGTAGGPNADALAVTAASVIRPALAVTCEAGSEAVCETWCDIVGGGMSSNPDGSTTCSS